MNTLQLDIAYTYDFDLYGLVTKEKEYKLAWALNKRMAFHLVKQEDLCYDLVEQEHMIVSNYEYISDYSTVRLLKNRAVGNATIKMPFLLPELKEYDYVLQISGSLKPIHPQDFLQKLLHVPLVEYVKQVDPLTLKHKDNLIF